MPTINVAKAFTYQHDPEQTGTRYDEKLGKDVPMFAAMGHQQRFTVGQHEVTEAVANHWYVRAHLEGYVSPGPVPGQADFAQQQALAAQAARNGTSVEAQMAKPAPVPPNVEVMHTTGEVPPDAHYFAGGRQPEPQQPAGVSYLGRS